jgi:hypothetical protein
MLLVEGDVPIANILVVHEFVYLKERLEFFSGQVARQKVVDVRIEGTDATYSSGG